MFSDREFYGLSKKEQLELAMAREQLRLVWWIRAWAGATFVVVVGLLIAVVVLLAGMSQTGTMMKKTTESTVGMRSDMQDAIGNGTIFLKDLQKHFPKNQAEVTAGQLLGIVQNVHNITSKAASMTPDQLKQITAHLDSALVSVRDTVNAIREGTANPKLNATLVHVQKLIVGTKPDSLGRLVESIGSLSQHASALAQEAERGHMVNKLDAVLVELRAIGERAKKLHEIAIKI